MKTLTRTEFGNPVLREQARILTPAEIRSVKTKQLIRNMRYTLTSLKLGIGLAAPQVGEGLALAVIAIHPTKHRPNVKAFDLVIINPEIIKTNGRRQSMWEGCLSAGRSGLFAKVPRYQRITVRYYDEQAKQRTRQFKGLPAQVIQHEIDHLNGALFMDKVKDTSTYMTLREYHRRIASKRKAGPSELA